MRYLQNRPANPRQEVDRDVLWFIENCSAKADKVFDAYKDLLERALKVEVFYQLVSTQEKQDIFEAFHSGMPTMIFIYLHHSRNLYR